MAVSFYHYYEFIIVDPAAIWVHLYPLLLIMSSLHENPIRCNTFLNDNCFSDWFISNSSCQIGRRIRSIYVLRRRPFITCQCVQYMVRLYPSLVLGSPSHMLTSNGFHWAATCAVFGGFGWMSVNTQSAPDTLNINNSHTTSDAINIVSNKYTLEFGVDNFSWNG